MLWLGRSDTPSVTSAEVLPLPRLTTPQVEHILRDEGWVAVDTRISDAYNGWALDGLARGGHLPGAVDFSARWLEIEGANQESRLADAIRIKGITPDKHVLLYDANGTDHIRVAAYLRDHGYQRLNYYCIRPWAEDRTLPLDRYPGFWRLVPPVIVKQLMAGQRPATFADVQEVIFAEASWGAASKSYDKGHLPGSFHINTDAIEPPPHWLLADADTLRRFASGHGLHHEHTIVVSSETPMAAHRVAVVLRYMGVRDVRVLNGGTAAWVHAGYALDTEPHDPPPAQDFGVTIPARPEIVDSMDRIRASLRHPADFLLVDVRSWPEYAGDSTGYAYCSKAGRVPGAVFGFGGPEGVDVLDYYRNVDDTMRNADEIRAMWSQAGIDVNKHISFMCGSGWRAAEVLSYAHVMGLESTSMYSNGWIEWSSSQENPLEAPSCAPPTWNGKGKSVGSLACGCGLNEAAGTR